LTSARLKRSNLLNSFLRLPQIERVACDSQRSTELLYHQSKNIKKKKDSNSRFQTLKFGK